MSATVTIKLLEDHIKETDCQKSKSTSLKAAKTFGLIVEDCQNLIKRTPKWMLPTIYFRFGQMYTKLEPGDVIAIGAMYSIGGPGESELRPTNGEGAGFTPAELNDGNEYFNPLHITREIKNE